MDTITPDWMKRLRGRAHAQHDSLLDTFRGSPGTSGTVTPVSPGRASLLSPEKFVELYGGLYSADSHAGSGVLGGTNRHVGPDPSTLLFAEVSAKIRICRLKKMHDPSMKNSS